PEDRDHQGASSTDVVGGEPGDDPTEGPAQERGGDQCADVGGQPFELAAGPHTGDGSRACQDECVGLESVERPSEPRCAECAAAGLVEGAQGPGPIAGVECWYAAFQVGQDGLLRAIGATPGWSVAHVDRGQNGNVDRRHEQVRKLGPVVLVV